MDSRRCDPSCDSNYGQEKSPIGQTPQDLISERARKSFEEEVTGKHADHEPDGTRLGHHHYQGNIDNDAGQF
uniref:Uncharacterized protein n=1 Tax=Acrobeloides nanus TaxID=290746 RepID=A0A914D5V4_9BILA